MHAFFENVILANLNPLSSSAFAFNLYLLGLFQTAPIVAALVGVWPRLTRRAGRDLLLMAWLASIVPLLGIAKEGADFDLSPTLQALAPYKDQVLVLTGLDDEQAANLPGDSGGIHSRSQSSWLTGVRAKRTDERREFLDRLPTPG